MTLITPKAVTAKTRKLSAAWSMDDSLHETQHWLWKWVQEVSYRMRYLVTGKWPAVWVEDRLAEEMAADIRKEIDNEILDMLRAQQDKMGM